MRLYNLLCDDHDRRVRDLHDERGCVAATPPRPVRRVVRTRCGQRRRPVARDRMTGL